MIPFVEMGVATILVLLWSYLHIKYINSYNTVLAGIDSADYPLSELYYIGFGFMQMIKFDMERKQAKKRIKAISEVYGRKYATYYYYVLCGAKSTFLLTFIPIALLLAAIAAEPLAVFFGGAVTALLIWYLDEKVNDKVMGRHDELLKSYPQMLSKLTLLVNSGMPIRDAWGKVAESNEGLLYREMRLTSEELYNGISEVTAYKDFGERCTIKPLKKFSSMMIQNLQKGSAEVVSF